MASSHIFKLKVAITEKVNKWKWAPMTQGTHKEHIDANTENFMDTGANDIFKAKYTNMIVIVK